MRQGRRQGGHGKRLHTYIVHLLGDVHTGMGKRGQNPDEAR